MATTPLVGSADRASIDWPKAGKDVSKVGCPLSSSCVKNRSSGPRTLEGAVMPIVPVKVPATNAPALVAATADPREYVPSPSCHRTAPSGLSFATQAALAEGVA